MSILPTKEDLEQGNAEYIRELELKNKAFKAEVKQLRELLEKANCPNKNCDNKGTIANQIAVDDWTPEPCQWCYEREQQLKSK